MSYTDFLDRALYHNECLETLNGSGALPVDRLIAIREATIEDLTGLSDRADRAELLRSLLLYANNALDEAHRIVQHVRGDLASYLHGMIHRRQEDFDNARHWFRRAGELPFFQELQRKGAALSEDVAKQTSWDPYLFTGLCERHKYGSRTPISMLVSLQKAEFLTYLDYVFRAG